MAENTKVNQDYEAIISFREGAHYCKMDLHTHTPGSECSSFTLPTNIRELLPKSPKSKTDKWYNECVRFLEELAEGEDLFGNALQSDEIKERPWMVSPPEANTRTIEDIAGVWLEDMKKLGSPEDIKKNSQLKKEWQQYIKEALQDVEKYLASLFFPEEFVMRCYIEELQIVALTDHNHPGYIVTRLPRLGTWYSFLQEVNRHYEDDISSSQNPGEKIRKIILKRLKLAKSRLEKEKDFKEESRKILKDEHKERKKVEKKLANLTKRLEHVNERIVYWENSHNKPGRLVLLPGVEFTVSNVHLLSVFPPLWYVPGRIGSILRAIGIPEEHWGKGFLAAASSSVQDTITLVNEKGGIVIPAHSNSNFKGVLRLFKDGLSLKKVLEHKALLALESIGGSILAGTKGKKAKDTCQTLKWMDKGNYAPKRGMPLTFVKGSDAHECRIELDGTGEDLGSRFSYIKMDMRPRDTAEEVFRALRLALTSGYSRILECPPEDSYIFSAPKNKYRIKKTDRIQMLKSKEIRPTILGMTISGEGSYADGLQIRFNPYLNCIVGSEGKVTLIRMVGYGFGAFKFWVRTSRQWLPDTVRTFWRQQGEFFCVQRKGRNIDPNNPDIDIRLYKLDEQDQWEEIEEWNGINKNNIPSLVEVWPPPGEENAYKRMAEDKLINALIKSLKFSGIEGVKPLLINQPRDIFNNEKIFNAVLSRPLIKARQIIWSTGSPNVPAALDAEKIIITREKKRGKLMEIHCAGDLHEDEIREQFLNHFEGGWAGFARRDTIYSS